MCGEEIKKKDKYCMMCGESQRDNTYLEKKIRRILFVSVSMVLLVLSGFMMTQQPLDQKKKQPVDFVLDSIVYVNDTGTYLCIDEKSFLIDDKKLNIQSKFNMAANMDREYRVNLKYNNYISEKIAILKSESNGVYLINLEKEEVYNFEEVTEFQICDNEKEILVLVDNQLKRIKVDTIKETEVITDHVKRFVASEDFSHIIVRTLDQSLIEIDKSGKEISIIDVALDVSVDEDYMAIVGDLIFVALNEKINIYSIEEKALVDVIDSDVGFKFDKYFLSFPEPFEYAGDIYEVKDKKVVEIVRQTDEKTNPMYLEMNEEHYTFDNSLAYSIMYKKNNKLYLKYLGSSPMELEINLEAYIPVGMLEGSSTMVFALKNDRRNLRSVDLATGEIVDDFSMEKPVKSISGYSKKNFIYADQETYSVRYFNGNKEVAIGEEVNSSIEYRYLVNDEYILVFENGIYRLTPEGTMEKIYNGTFERTYYNIFDKELYIKKVDQLVVINDKNEMDIKMADQMVFRNNKIYYLDSGRLYKYQAGQSELIADNTSGMIAMGRDHDYYTLNNQMISKFLEME